MGIAVAGLIAGLSQSVKNASRLTDYDRAAMLAHTKMNDLLLGCKSSLRRVGGRAVRSRPNRGRPRRMACLSQTFRSASPCGPRHGDSATNRAGTVVAASNRNAPRNSTGKLSPGAHSHPGRPMRNNPESGVTLIEILIAVSLLSLLSVGMLVAMRLGFNTMDKTDTRLVQNRRVANSRRSSRARSTGSFFRGPTTARSRLK